MTAQIGDPAGSMQLVMGALSRLVTWACEAEAEEEGRNLAVAVAAALREELSFWEGCRSRPKRPQITRLAAGQLRGAGRTRATPPAQGPWRASWPVAHGYLSLEDKAVIRPRDAGSEVDAARQGGASARKEGAPAGGGQYIVDRLTSDRNHQLPS
jgi:hypothetical protein